jgi:hypothetical protein
MGGSGLVLPAGFNRASFIFLTATMVLLAKISFASW